MLIHNDNDNDNDHNNMRPQINQIIGLFSEFLGKIKETSKNDLIICFSALTTGSLLRIIHHLGVDLYDMKGKNIMSVGEGIPFLAKSLNNMGANVTAVDPLYSKGHKVLYEKAECAIEQIPSRYLDNSSVNNLSLIRQLRKVATLLKKGEKEFQKQLFETDNIKFNGSYAENISGVGVHSQDIVIMAFLLNNLKTSDDVSFAIAEALNKLKKGGKLIIIGPDDMASKGNDINPDIQILDKRYPDKKIYTYNDDELNNYLGLCYTKT